MRRSKKETSRVVKGALFRYTQKPDTEVEKDADIGSRERVSRVEAEK